MVLPSDSPENGADWNRWRGAVDTTLVQVNTRLANVETETKETNKALATMPADIAQAIKSGEAAPAPGNGQPITFKWLTEKALVPVLLAIGMLVAGYLLNS